MTGVAEVREPELTAAIGKRFQQSRKRLQAEAGPHAAAIHIGSDGSITQLSPAARHLLEYKPEQDVEPCFFSHVHGRNLYQVMRDVADMVCYGKMTASWLVRLRTGQGRWRWFKATVANKLNGSEGGITVVLRDLHEW